MAVTVGLGEPGKPSFLLNEFEDCREVSKTGEAFDTGDAFETGEPGAPGTGFLLIVLADLGEAVLADRGKVVFAAWGETSEAGESLVL